MSIQISMKKSKKSHSFSATLAVAFFSMSLTSLFVFGFFGLYFGCLSQQRIVFSNQQLIAQDAAHKVSHFIDEKLGLLEITARLVNPAVTPQEEQKRILAHLLGIQPAFRQIVLLNIRKQETARVSRLSQIASSELNKRVKKDLFSRISRGKGYIGTVYIDPVTCEPMVILAVATKDVFDYIEGTLIAEVNLKFMWNLLEGLKIGKTGHAYVVDRHGDLIGFKDIARVLRGENIKNLKVVAEYIKYSKRVYKKQAQIFKGITGRTVVGTYVPLDVPDWAVVTEVPIMEAYDRIILNVTLTIALMLLIAVLAAWASSYLAQRLTVPLVDLMQTATKISEGEIALQAKVSGPTEVASLASAFNIMTAQLQAVIYSLEERGQYLQATVQKYVEFMAEVGKGKLDGRLKLDRSLGDYDPLIALGQQLNETTSSLQRMTESLQEREEELEVYAEKLKKSNTELEQFAYVASHDLQEPLRKIQVFGDRLKENYSNFFDERALDYFQRMSSAVTRMGTLINDLLQYSRVTSQVRPYESVDLKKILTEVVNDMEIRINETNAEIHTDSLPVIDADPLQMKQLFQNIIGNAIKYKKENVPPVIKIHSKIITDKCNNQCCKIDFTDNGIGFDNQYAEKIFGLFQRLYGRGEYDGTGIGLAICRKIVTEHGGSITAESKVGEGSTFTVILPLNRELHI